MQQTELKKDAKWVIDMGQSCLKTIIPLPHTLKVYWSLFRAVPPRYLLAEARDEMPDLF